VLGLLARPADKRSSNEAMDETGRAVISGSRLLNVVFGLPRNGKNIARSLGTFQSGSPPAEWNNAAPRLGASIGLATRLLVQNPVLPQKSEDCSGASPYRRMSGSSSLPFSSLTRSHHPLCVRMNSYRRRVWVRPPYQSRPVNAVNRPKPNPRTI
jgi:hypothetical protein